MPHLSLHSPVGDLTLFEADGALVALEWGWADGGAPTPLLQTACNQLGDYFDGKARAFDLPLAPAGTPFQRRVWQALSALAYGETTTYGTLAACLGSSARAVGSACGRNPLPLIIPCHRVLAANGALRGYSGEGGLDTKLQLLRMEAALIL